MPSSGGGKEEAGGIFSLRETREEQQHQAPGKWVKKKCGWQGSQSNKRDYSCVDISSKTLSRVSAVCVWGGYKRQGRRYGNIPHQTNITISFLVNVYRRVENCLVMNQECCENVIYKRVLSIVDLSCFSTFYLWVRLGIAISMWPMSGMSFRWHCHKWMSSGVWTWCSQMPIPLYWRSAT